MNGNSSESIKRVFRTAEETERQTVLNLYRSVLSGPFSVWNELYPGMEEIEHDTETGNLFVLTEDNRIIGAVSVVPENEMDDMDCWKEKNAAEIARVVICPDRQGDGLAAVLVSEILKVLAERKVRAVHLSAAVRNIPAVRTYQHLGFDTVGEADMYGNHYILMELCADENGRFLDE